MTATERPARYRRIPTEAEAMQFDGTNLRFITAWIGEQRIKRIPFSTRVCLWVDANHSWVDITTGEWILQDSLGFYPCSDKIFKDTYALIPKPKPAAPDFTFSGPDPANIVALLSRSSYLPVTGL